MYTYKYDVAVRFKTFDDNSVEVVLKYNPKTMHATAQQEEDFKKKYKEERNAVLLGAKGFIEAQFERASSHEIFCMGLYDKNKKTFKLYEVTSFVENPSPGAREYNFLYANNSLIDLDTIGVQFTYRTLLSESDESDKASKALIKDLNNKIYGDIATNNERQRKSNNEDTRLGHIKEATAGDLMVNIKDAQTTPCYDMGLYKKGVSYNTTVIKSYIERVEGQKFQIRIAEISFYNPPANPIAEVTTTTINTAPEINGIKIARGDLLWINPYKDQDWYWGETE